MMMMMIPRHSPYLGIISTIRYIPQLDELLYFRLDFVLIVKSELVAAVDPQQPGALGYVFNIFRYDCSKSV